MKPVLDNRELQKQHSCKDLVSTASSGDGEKDKAKLMADHSEHSKLHPPSVSPGVPNKRNISVGSIQNERYSLGSPPSSDHDNEDELMFHSNKYSLCMCVFDGHDGTYTVKFLKRYMNQQVFGKTQWDDITKSSKPEKIEAALTNYIQKSDWLFFVSIRVFANERRMLQSRIPKVNALSILYYQELILYYHS